MTQRRAAKPPAEQNCFERLGMKVTTRKGGGRCACGELVRFDIVTQRTAHFLVCPVVDRKIAKAQASIVVDDSALLGYELGRSRLLGGA